MDMVDKVKCPFCGARFKWHHLHKGRHGKDFVITRDYVTPRYVLK